MSGVTPDLFPPPLICRTCIHWNGTAKTYAGYCPAANSYRVGDWEACPRWFGKEQMYQAMKERKLGK